MTKRLNTPRNVKAASIYREAALKIERGEEDFACCAISLIVHGSASSISTCEPFRRAFDEVYKPTDGGGAYFGYHMGNDERNARILALCFMAAITERP